MFTRRITEQLAQVTASLNAAEVKLAQLEAAIDNGTHLISIERTGPTVTLLFSRRGEITRLDVYADLSLNVAQLRKDLIE